MTRDLISNITTNTTLAPVVRLTSGSPYNGTGVDTRGTEAAAAYATVGTPGVTLSGSITIEFDLQESDDNTTFTGVAAADLTNPVTGVNAGCFALLGTSYTAAAVFSTGYSGTKRYLRVVEVHAGTQATGTPSAVVIVLSNYAYRPVTGNAT